MKLKSTIVPFLACWFGICGGAFTAPWSPSPAPIALPDLTCTPHSTKPGCQTTASPAPASTGSAPSAGGGSGFGGPATCPIRGMCGF